MIPGPTHLHEFERDNGDIVVIEYKINPFDPGVSYGPPESCYPPEGGDIADWEVDGGKVELTEAEAERAEKEIYANPPDPYDAMDDRY